MQNKQGDEKKTTPGMDALGESYFEEVCPQSVASDRSWRGIAYDDSCGRVLFLSDEGGIWSLGVECLGCGPSSLDSLVDHSRADSFWIGNRAGLGRTHDGGGRRCDRLPTAGSHDSHGQGAGLPIWSSHPRVDPLFLDAPLHCFFSVER